MNIGKGYEHPGEPEGPDPHFWRGVLTAVGFLALAMLAGWIAGKVAP